MSREALKKLLMIKLKLPQKETTALKRLQRSEAYELFIEHYEKLPVDSEERDDLKTVANSIGAFTQRFNRADKAGKSINLLGIERRTEKVEGENRHYYVDVGSH